MDRHGGGVVLVTVAIQTVWEERLIVIGGCAEAAVSLPAAVSP